MKMVKLLLPPGGKVIIYARDGRYSDKQASVEVLVPYKMNL